MGVVSYFSNLLNRSASNELNKILGSSILSGYVTVGDHNILNSSDVYRFMKDVSDMVACSNFTVENYKGDDVNNVLANKFKKRPNDYLTNFEFKKLLIHQFLLYGEVFVVRENDDFHIVKGIRVEVIDGQKVYKYEENILPYRSVAHIKNIGTSHLNGIGLIDMASSTLDSIANAEKTVNDKYTKGGLLAYMLKIDAHLSPNNKQQMSLITNIQNKLTQTQDKGKTVIIPLSKGYSIESIESPIDDEKIINYLKVYKKEVTKYFGFDPDAYSKLIENDLEKAALYLYNWIVKPLLRNVDEHLTFLFYGEKSSLSIKTRVDLTEYITMKDRITNNYNLVRSAIYTPDDARLSLGKDALNTEQSSKLYISKDLTGINELDTSEGGETNDSKETN